MKPPPEPGLKINRIDHISFAVPDAEAVALRLTRLLDLAVTLDADVGGTRKILLDMGNATLELLQSENPDSRTGAFLKRHGPGFFHLCLEVGDLDAALRDLKGRGVAALHDAPIATNDGGRAAFLDPATTGGVALELKQPGRTTPDG